MTSACWECPVIRVITWFSPSSWLADRLNSYSTRCYSVKVSLSHYLAVSWIEFECMNVSDRSCCISVISHYSSDWYSITFQEHYTIYIKQIRDAGGEVESLQIIQLLVCNIKDHMCSVQWGPKICSNLSLLYAFSSLFKSHSSQLKVHVLWTFYIEHNLKLSI